MAKASNNESEQLELPKSEVRTGPKHPVALPKQNPRPKPQKRDLLQQAVDAQARKWDGVLAELSEEERAHLREMRKQHEVAARPVWHLVEIQDGQYPQLHSYATIDELVVQLKELADVGNCRVFPFYGERLSISVGPLRYLLLPDKEPIPLFDLPETVLPDDTGYLGDPDAEPEGLAFESPLNRSAQGDANDGLDEIGAEESPTAAWSDEEDPEDDDVLSQPDD